MRTDPDDFNALSRLFSATRLGQIWLARAGSPILLGVAILLVHGCVTNTQAGSDCEEQDCVLSAAAALSLCRDSCEVLGGQCTDARPACQDDCQTEIDDGMYVECSPQFELLHACCGASSDYECEYPGLDECKAVCPTEYVEYRACTISEGAHLQGSMPGEMVGSCVDICGQIDQGCPSPGSAVIDECISECAEVRGDCSDRLAWLELAACCAGADYEPICSPQMRDLDIKRCRQACPEQWNACEGVDNDGDPPTAFQSAG